MSNDGAGLRECPGCGDKCTRVIGGPGTRGGPMFWAGCDVCRWRTWGNTEDEAIAAWNRRALSAVAPPPVLEGLASVDFAVAVMNAANAYAATEGEYPAPKDRATLRAQVARLRAFAGERIDADNESRIAASPAAPAQPEMQAAPVAWIPVSERLPIDAATFSGVYETVQVMAYDGTRVAEVTFCAGNGAGKPWAAFGEYESLNPLTITHWQALPPPPTGE